MILAGGRTCFSSNIKLIWIFNTYIPDGPDRFARQGGSACGPAYDVLKNPSPIARKICAARPRQSYAQQSSYKKYELFFTINHCRYRRQFFSIFRHSLLHLPISKNPPIHPKEYTPTNQICHYCGYSYVPAAHPHHAYRQYWRTQLPPHQIQEKLFHNSTFLFTTTTILPPSPPIVNSPQFDIYA